MRQATAGSTTRCPKCSFQAASDAIDCPRCGIVFGKVVGAERAAEIEADLATLRPTYTQRLGAHRITATLENEANGTIGPAEWKILAIGLALAICAYGFPLTRKAFSAMVTLFHEMGHAVAGWLLGCPSLPSFDLVYGGGITHHSEFQLPLALLIGAGFVYACWHFRENRATATIIGALFLLWLVAVSAGWRRELFFSAAGHLSEFIMAGIFFYRSLAGVGWKAPEVERPLGAFVAFFVQINSMAFAWRLLHDSDFMAWYREGKGGMLMNDLEAVALDLQIHFGWRTSIEGVSRALLVFSLVPMTIALIWFFQRSRIHAGLQWLRTAW